MRERIGREGEWPQYLYLLSKRCIEKPKIVETRRCHHGKAWQRMSDCPVECRASEIPVCITIALATDRILLILLD